MSALTKLFLIFSCWGAALSCDESHPDFIPHMPGLNQPLPSSWYSGYLTYEFQDRTIHTHYVYVEAEVTEDEEEKPLIYWSNGGPGASSLFGLMTELGPLLFSDASKLTDDFRATGIPSPLYNSNSWSRLGSILIIDQPAPIGFSYCNDDVHGQKDCDGMGWTDELTSANAYAALQAFYKEFPCFSKGRDLFLTGESYGGIYIPTLARRVLEGGDPDMVLKGFAVGDGCLGTETGICSDLGGNHSHLWNVLFLFGHGQMPVTTYRKYMQACVYNDGYGDWTKAIVKEEGEECQEVLKEIEMQVGGFYEYNLYDDCTYRNGILTGALNDYACGGDIVLEEYFTLPSVLEAFHVKDNYYSVDNAAGFDYTCTEKDLRPFYKSLADTDVRVLIYNGDTDPAITSMAAQNWTSHLDFDLAEEWRPWTVDGCRRMGGYVTRYVGGVDFLTIRGAGHMVGASPWCSHDLTVCSRFPRTRLMLRLLSSVPGSRMRTTRCLSRIVHHRFTLK